MTPFFSIIVPAFNVEKYIKKCIDSVLAQDYVNYEIIIVNDGSTDETTLICNEYCSLYPDKIKVIHKRNEGLSNARNDGVKNATGQYLFFLDSDDWLHNNYILTNINNEITRLNYPEVIINKVDKFYEEEGKLNCNIYRFNSRWGKLLPLQVMYKLLHIKGIFLGAQVFIISKDHFFNKDLWFYPGLFHEDLLWFPEVFIRSDRVSLSNLSIFCYRIGRSGSITGQFSMNKVYDQMKIIYLLVEEAITLSRDEKRIIMFWNRKILYQILKKHCHVKMDKDFCEEVKKVLSVLPSVGLFDRFIFSWINRFGINLLGFYKYCQLPKVRNQ